MPACFFEILLQILCRERWTFTPILWQPAAKIAYLAVRWVGIDNSIRRMSHDDAQVGQHCGILTAFKKLALVERQLFRLIPIKTG